MKHVLVLLSFLLPSFCYAQLEEIVVTASSRGGAQPGAVLKKTGDFLLLEVEIVNDSREAKQRASEIYHTLRNTIEVASKDKGIELSLVENGFVVPLNISNYRVKLNSGRRPDTSVATIRVKTAIPKTAGVATDLISKMRSFVKKITVNGRTQVSALGDVDVSLVAPGQYRDDILQLFADDVNNVTNKLGDEYKVVVQGIDQPVEWTRSGPLSLTLYVPYTYTVIPNNVTSILLSPDY